MEKKFIRKKHLKKDLMEKSEKKNYIFFRAIFHLTKKKKKFLKIT
jgi:hypothetical protein